MRKIVHRNTVLTEASVYFADREFHVSVLGPLILGPGEDFPCPYSIISAKVVQDSEAMEST